jgi:hypothetical protein
MGLDLTGIVSTLCSNLTTSKCAAPKRSDWALVEPGQSNIGVDVADLLTGGATTVVPINVKIYGSYFSCGLERRVRNGFSATVTGFGGGVGVGGGWGLPFLASGKVDQLSGIKKEVLKRFGPTIQDFGMDKLKGKANKASWTAATHLVTGPDTAGDLVLDDFHDSFAVVIGFGANAAVNGVSGGLVIFSKQRPILTPPDLVYAKAFGFFVGVALATTLDVEANSQYYRLRVTAP